MLVNQEQFRLLKKNTLFKGIPDSYLNSYLKLKNFVKVKDGEIFFSSGDISSKLYLIVEGEVKIKFNNDKNIKIKILCDFFGEAEILAESNRFSSAVANKDCVLYEISKAELKSISKSNGNVLTNFNKKYKQDSKETSSDENAEFDSISEKDSAHLKNEIIDFDKEKKKEIFIKLSEEELSDILAKQRSKNKLGGDLNDM